MDTQQLWDAHTASFSSNFTPHWVKVMLTIERPPAQALARLNRSDKYRLLLENTRQHRDQLLQWVVEHGLADEVARIGGPTSFNLLFVQCTPHAAQALAYAPGVVDIAVTDEMLR